MRNWNLCSASRICSSTVPFWSYLWGIETQTHKKRIWNVFSFWSYLWGIETQHIHLYYSSWLAVLIVPMRNWNSALAHKGGFAPRSFWSYLWGIETSSALAIVPEGGTFWSYLWGIETGWWSCSRRRKSRRFWSYLWGIETPDPMSGQQETRTVLIVPMRNWNDQISGAFKKMVSCFDRTYEELKQRTGITDKSLSR